MTDSTQKLLVWVRFPCLPIEYYDYEFLMKVGREIGEPKKVDQATSLASRGLLARVCVEVDVSKTLLVKFKLIKKIRTIEYEGLHMICFKCGMVGHQKEECKSMNNKKDEFAPENGDARLASTNEGMTEKEGVYSRKVLNTQGKYAED